MIDRRASARPTARSLVLAAGALAGLAALAGCGGKAGENPPQPAPPPAEATRTAADPEVTNPAQGDPSLATSRLASGYLYRFDMTQPANDNFAVTTREVYLYFKPDTTAVYFQLENRLGVAMRILWDECTFVDTDNRVFRAVHRGVRYSTRNQAQDPTWVQPGQRYSDFLVPVDLLNDPTAAEGEGMRKLFPTDVSANGYLGKSFGCTLVLEAANQRLEFPARFRIASVHPGT